MERASPKISRGVLKGVEEGGWVADNLRNEIVIVILAANGLCAVSG